MKNEIFTVLLSDLITALDGILTNEKLQDIVSNRHGHSAGQTEKKSKASLGSVCVGVRWAGSRYYSIISPPTET